MSDQLDTLTDAQLSKAFAVECAGYTKHNLSEGSQGTFWKDKEGAVTNPRTWRFATSADAIEPFALAWAVTVEYSRTWVDATVGTEHGMFFAMHAKPARAIATAILRAKRAGKGQS